MVTQGSPYGYHVNPSKDLVDNQGAIISTPLLTGSKIQILESLQKEDLYLGLLYM